MPDENHHTPAAAEVTHRSEILLMAAAESVNLLLTDINPATGIARALSNIGQAAEVDRVYIFENHQDPATGKMLTSQRYEWVREGVAAQIDNPDMINIDYMKQYKLFYETLSSGKPISALARELPAQEKLLLDSQQIISILLVPIKISGSFWGFIGFDDCRRERSWTSTEIATLTTVSINIVYLLLQKQTEQLLRRFQAALDGSSDAIGMADMQGHHFYQNEVFTKLFGYTVEELEKAGGPMVTYHDQAICRGVFKNILKGGSWHGELEMCSKSGEIMSIFLRADTIKDSDGKPFAVMGIHTDITKRKSTEKALQENELRYRRLVEAITDYIYTVKVENGRATSTTHAPNCLSVTGYTTDEFQADQDLWLKMVYTDDRQKVIQQAQNILNGITIRPIEHRIYHKNGSIRWVRNTPVPHYDSSNKLISYDGLIYDVTDRKKAEEKMKEHADHLETINRIITAVNRTDNLNMLLDEALKASMEMVLFDSGGIYLVNANNSTAGLVCHEGLSEDFIRQAGILQISAANNRMLFIEGNPVFTDTYSFAQSEQTAKWDMQSVAKIPLISKDNVIGAMALINSKGHTFNESEKELLISIGRQIGTAITKMRSETALRESERKYRTITEQSLVGIHIIKDSLMIFVNEGWTKITGYNSDEVKSWSLEEYLKIIHPEDRSLFLQQSRMKQMGIAENVLSIYDCRFLSKTGEVKWVSIHSRAVEFTDGCAVVGMIVDITDRKLTSAALVTANKQLTSINEHLSQREQELIKANSEKEVLLKEIHHRVKNNLQIINSLINLQIHNINDAAAVGLLKECQNRIKTIAMVHEKMYQIGDLARVLIGDYLESLTHHIKHMYLTDPLSVSITINAKDIILPIDKAIPCALLVNELVSNSLKYAFPKQKSGLIEINMSCDTDGQYMLIVADNGIGLPANIDYHKTKSLGMQLVTTFVNQLDGKIDLQRSQGTRFIIKFIK
jgi:PAS domain S-box-containing protein